MALHGRREPSASEAGGAAYAPAMSATRTDAPPLAELDEIQRRVLWLATRMIDYANRERPAEGPPQGRRAPGLVGVRS